MGKRIAEIGAGQGAGCRIKMTLRDQCQFFGCRRPHAAADAMHKPRASAFVREPAAAILDPEANTGRGVDEVACRERDTRAGIPAVAFENFGVP